MPLAEKVPEQIMHRCTCSLSKEKIKGKKGPSGNGKIGYRRLEDAAHSENAQA